MIRAAVLTISDSSARGTRGDVSGPAVVARLEGAGMEVVERALVPDERGEIAGKLLGLASGLQAGVIVTTGGTGLAPRDVTPEATRDVIEREIPGFGELMRSKGREFTPRASLSRALAGTVGGVLIINLPGSPRGAVQSLDAILELVPHVLDLINGRTGHSASGQEV
ncbi:MAG: MogA/MoaB family molybdenum cofactor biosynthesis protein [Terriglobia bacterium]